MDPHIHTVALTLSRNLDANLARTQIAGGLGLRDYEVQDIVSNAGTNNYDFYIRMLSRWKSKVNKMATLENLETVLKNLEMWNLADELSRAGVPGKPGSTGNQTNHTFVKSEPSGSRTPEKSQTGILANHVFTKCAETITTNLKSDSILFVLRCKHVLSEEESEKIRDLKTVANRERLITFMMTKDKRNVEKFIEVGKANTSGQDYIWEELENAIREFEAQAR